MQYKTHWNPKIQLKQQLLEIQLLKHKEKWQRLFVVRITTWQRMKHLFADLTFKAGEIFLI